MARLFYPILMAMLLSACVVHNSTIPVEDITKKESLENIEPEIIDLEPVKIEVEEPKEIVVRDDGNVERDSDMELIEITKVGSKPANQLLNQANDAIDAGNYNKANMFLDRALVISPRDPKLWHKKSQVMYLKGDYNQAANTAMRSNAMTTKNLLKKQNWLIIANSREKMGDFAGAEKARKFARQ